MLLLTGQRPARKGRGGRYGPFRARLEWALTQLYRGDWPARLWSLSPGACRVTCVRHALKLLPPGSQTLRIGFVSDLHIGPTTPPQLLDAAFTELARERLDVLLLGGDYVFLEATEQTAARLAALVSRVPAARKLAVLGNHDLWTDHALLETALEQVGVEWLTNRSARLASSVAVVGLDDPWTGNVDALAALRGVQDAAAIVVLCHSPDGLPDAKRAVERLAISASLLYVCGHTHGGQIASPWGPLLVPGIVGKRYPHGFHEVQPFQLHVSRGVGATELPIRTYASPEIAVFELSARVDADSGS